MGDGTPAFGRRLSKAHGYLTFLTFQNDKYSILTSKSPFKTKNSISCSNIVSIIYRFCCKIDLASAAESAPTTCRRSVAPPAGTPASASVTTTGRLRVNVAATPAPAACATWRRSRVASRTASAPAPSSRRAPSRARLALPPALKQFLFSFCLLNSLFYNLM